MMEKFLFLHKTIAISLAINKLDTFQSILCKTLIKTALLTVLIVGLILGIYCCSIGYPIFGTFLFTIGGLSVYFLTTSNLLQDFIFVMAIIYMLGNSISLLIISAENNSSGWSVFVTGIMIIFAFVLMKTYSTLTEQNN